MTHSGIEVGAFDQYGHPIANVAIALNDSRGAFVEMTHTDATGRAWVRPMPRGSITSYDLPTIPSMLSMATVFEPGSGPVAFMVTRNPPPDPPATTFSVTITNAPPGTTQFVGGERCTQGQSATATLPLTNDNCPAEPSDSIFVLARGGATEAWGWAQSVPVQPGGVVPVTLDVGNTAFVTHTLTADHLPPGFTNPSGIYQAIFLVTDTSFGVGEWFGEPVSSTVGTSAGSWTLSLPDAPFPATIALFGANYTTGSLIGLHVGPTSDASLSFVDLPLAAVSPIDLSDPIHPAVRWTAPGPVNDDVETVYSGWSAAGGKTVTWNAVQRGLAGTQIVVPQVAPEFLSFVPATGPYAAVGTQVQLLRITPTPSYGEIVRDPAWLGLTLSSEADALLSLSNAP